MRHCIWLQGQSHRALVIIFLRKIKTHFQGFPFSMKAFIRHPLLGWAPIFQQNYLQVGSIWGWWRRGGILIRRGRSWLVGLFGATSSLPRAKPGEEKPCPSTHAHHVKSLGSGLPWTLEGFVGKRFCANTCSSNETHIPWHQRVEFHYGKHFCNGNQGKGCKGFLTCSKGSNPCLKNTDFVKAFWHKIDMSLP